MGLWHKQRVHGLRMALDGSSMCANDRFCCKEGTRVGWKRGWPLLHAPTLLVWGGYLFQMHPSLSKQRKPLPKTNFSDGMDIVNGLVKLMEKLLFLPFCSLIYNGFCKWP